MQSVYFWVKAKKNGGKSSFFFCVLQVAENDDDKRFELCFTDSILVLFQVFW